MTQPPASPTPPVPPSGGAPVDPASAVSAPAIGLMAAAGVGIIVQLISFFFNLLGAGVGAAAGRQGIASMFSGGVGMAINVVGLIVAVVILLGAMKMKNLQSYGFAMAASILAMPPCISPCCILGLPFGIWALVILLKPEVKAAFKS